MNLAPQFNFQFSNPIENPYGVTTVGQYSIFNFVDLDNDGDLDAFAGSRYGDLFYFENTGSSESPQFSISQRNPFGLTNEAPHSSPEFVDFDNDGDLDAFVGAADGNIYYAENVGSASNAAFAPAVENPFGFVNVEFSTTPTFADLDNDGDLDAFVGSVDGNIYYYQNSGNQTQPLTLTETNPFSLDAVTNFSYIRFGDLDNDGDLDAIIGARDGNLYYQENVGTVDAPTFANAQVNPFGLTDIGDRSTPTFTDLDGDGGIDIAVGTKEGNLQYFRNNSTAPEFNLAEISVGETDNAGTSVAEIIPDGVVFDADGVSEAIAITGVDDEFGTWQYSLDDGENWLDVGTVSDGSALLLDSDDLVRFVPRGRFSGSADFNFRLWDQSSGEAGNKFDVRDNGGETAFSETVAMASITVATENNAPDSLSFAIANPDLIIDNPYLTITEAWVYDADGTSDLASVDLWMSRGNQTIDLEDITSFTAWDGNNRWANFDYELDLSDYNPGLYTLYAQAYDQQGVGSNIAEQSFSFNSLIFGIGSGVYMSGETINLSEAWIYNSEGSDNLDFIDFALRSESGEIIDLEDVTNFTPWDGGDEWSSFEYSIDTATIERGEYTLIATAFDQSGNIISTVEEAIEINNSAPPNSLEFYLPETQYMVGDTLEVAGGWIYDADGYSDLSSIDFMLIASDGEIFDVEDVTSFTPWDGDSRWASYSHSINLDGYENGYYTLSAQAYDQGGDMSQRVSDEIRITNSNPPDGLQFQTDKFNYLSSETLDLAQGIVFDSDDGSDVASVDFWVRKPDGEWVDVSDARSFTTNGDAARFNYSLNLAPYNQPGAYTLWGEAYDQGGDTSNASAVSFMVNNSSPPNQFQFIMGRSLYIDGDVLNTDEGWVYDADGADTLASIDFWLYGDNSGWIDVEDVTSFEVWDQNDLWAKFEYNLDLVGYEAGYYELWGEVYDEGGDVSAPLIKEFELFNSLPPQELYFSLDQSQYFAGETLNLSNGWVYDGDGAEDLASVDFWLYHDGEWTDIADATNFVPYEVEEWADFEYSLDLAGYESGYYELWGQAYDQGGDVSEPLIQEFELFNSLPPEDLFFSLDQSQYLSSETLNLSVGWVYDGDGAEDLASVDFWLYENGEWTDLADATDFIPYEAEGWADFEYSLDLSGYESGTYGLWGQAYDQDGQASESVTKFFEVSGSNEPQDLQYSIGNRQNYWSDNDSVDIVTGWVYDADGTEDLASIDFWIRSEDGEWQDLDDIVEFTAWSGGDEWAQFGGTVVELNGYDAGLYTLWSAAYDQGGDVSNAVTKTFRVFEGDANNVLASEEVDASFI